MASTELGAALRRWRDQLAPDRAGLPSGSHRRAAGLRREELAQLAGISVDYVTRLEQGRATNPSAQVVEALARALRLSPDGRAHLFQLAGLAPPGPECISTYVTPSVQRVIDRLSNTPVAVFDAAWTQLVANPLYMALIGEWQGNDLNAVWRNFLGGGTRVRHTPESLGALRALQVADLRRTASHYPNDKRLHHLISQLRLKSTEFDALWESGAASRHDSARKTIDHPHVGALTLDCDVLTVAGSDLRIMIYTAECDSPDAERLSLLDVVGTQTLTG
ncbi:helix-turn-helix transcriptional regulator [Streptomyces sp. NPDC054864]